MEQSENQTPAGAELQAPIAILPLGATEYHGPHLPADTDSRIAAAVARRLVDAIDGEVPLRLLPVEERGYSPEHGDHPSTLSLGYDEAICRWMEIGARLSGEGCRKMLLLNAHGGNSPLLTIIATELRIRHEMLCVASSWLRFGTPAGLIDDAEIRYGIHGGEIETSVMLALDAERVAMAQARNFESRQAFFETEFRYLRAYGPHAFGWKMSDLNLAGAVGNAAAATPKKGEALLSHSVSGLSELVRDMHRFDTGWFDLQQR